MKLTALALLFQANAHATNTKAPSPGTDHATTPYQTLINQRLEDYNRAFPDMLFTHLHGGEHWHGEMIALVTALGTNPVPLDYQHPPAARQQLADKTLERLVWMLKLSTVSSTVWQVGSPSPVPRKFVCAITLDTSRVAPDSKSATRHMLELPEQEFSRVDSSRYLDVVQHLTFTIDHEIYHCLKSVYIGGYPMTSDALEAEYAMHLNEGSADIFALARHLGEHGIHSPYARNLALVRGLALYTANQNHATYNAVRAILHHRSTDLKNMSPKDLVDLAYHLGTEVAGGLNRYIDRRVAALEAMKILNLKIDTGDRSVTRLLSREPDADKVQALVRQYHFLRQQLLGRKPVQLSKYSPDNRR